MGSKKLNKKPANNGKSVPLFEDDVMRVTLPKSAGPQDIADTLYAGFEHYDKNERVVVIGDVHNRALENLTLAIKIAKKNGLSLGLEIVDPIQESALAKARLGQLSKNNFIKLMTNGEGHGGPIDYMGDKKAKAFWGALHDAVTSGLEVHGLQSPYGIEVGKNFAFDDLPKLNVWYDASKNLMNAKIEDIELLENQYKFSKNPKVAMNALLNDLKKSPLLDTKTSEALENFRLYVTRLKRLDENHTENLKNICLELLAAANPQAISSEMAVTRARYALSGLDIMTSSDVNVDARHIGDANVAEKIAGIIGRDPLKGMVVVYGEGHFNHNTTEGSFDIDTRLRMLGIKTAIYEINYDVQNCNLRNPGHECYSRNGLIQEDYRTGDPARYQFDVKLTSP